MRTLIVLLVIAAATSAGYGYWHRSTFSTFHLSLRDVSERSRGGAVLGAQLTFLDADSRLLARGKHANVVITAVARELIAFVWAIAKEVPLSV